MRFTSLAIVALPFGALLAQEPAGPPSPKPVSLTEAQQIVASVLPLPAESRASAKVMGYKNGSPSLVTLREGKTFTCFLPEPTGTRYHAACYHQTLEPFMARGRALRAAGTKDEQVDTVRFAEVKSGKLAMPKQPASMYQLFGGAFDPATGTANGARPLIVVYIAGATGASTGIPEKPSENGMWIMYPGTPKAHIMLSPKM